MSFSSAYPLSIIQLHINKTKQQQQQNNEKHKMFEDNNISLKFRKHIIMEQQQQQQQQLQMSSLLSSSSSSSSLSSSSTSSSSSRIISLKTTTQCGENVFTTTTTSTSFGMTTSEGYAMISLTRILSFLCIFLSILFLLFTLSINLDNNNNKKINTITPSATIMTTRPSMSLFRFNNNAESIINQKKNNSNMIAVVATKPKIKLLNRNTNNNNTSLALNMIKPIIIESLLVISLPAAISMVPYISSIQSSIWLITPFLLPLRRIRMGRIISSLLKTVINHNNKVIIGIKASSTKIIRYIPSLHKRWNFIFNKMYKGMISIYSKTGASKIVTRSKKMIKILLHHSHNDDDHDDDHIEETKTKKKNKTNK